MEESRIDKRTARTLLAYFIHKTERIPIQIEYRYAPGVGFDLYTVIHEKVLQFSELKFFDVLSKLLDQLPSDASLMIPHQIILVDLVNHRESIVTLEEWLYPYKEKDSSTVIYQLKLLFDDTAIETKTSTAFSVVMRELQHKLGDKFQLKVCGYCKYLVEESFYGGTDSRHDQLYCFRDCSALLDTVLATHPRLYARDPMLAKATPDMDALHSCSAFTFDPARLLLP